MFEEKLRSSVLAFVGSVRRGRHYFAPVLCVQQCYGPLSLGFWYWTEQVALLGVLVALQALPAVKLLCLDVSSDVICLLKRLAACELAALPYCGFAFSGLFYSDLTS
jgi:hypothetical protein